MKRGLLRRLGRRLVLKARKRRWTTISRQPSTWPPDDDRLMVLLYTRGDLWGDAGQVGPGTSFQPAIAEDSIWDGDMWRFIEDPR